MLSTLNVDIGGSDNVLGLWLYSVEPFIIDGQPPRRIRTEEQLSSL